MPRRMIDPAFWKSENLAHHPVAIRYFFIGLFSNADDQGRLAAHPALLRSTIYPYDDIALGEIRTMTEELAEDGGPILLYEADGKLLIQIVKWWNWQHLQWAWPSEMEPPPGWTDRHCYRRGNNVVVKQNWGQSIDAPIDAASMPPPQSIDAPPDASSNSNSNSGSNRGSGSKEVAVAIAVDEPNRVAAALSALSDLRLPEPISEKRRHLLAAEPFMTADYVDAVYRRWRKKPGKGVGLLITMLASGEVPRGNGNGQDAEENRRRYAEHEGVIS